eukprot:XP_011678313.1 PREDICTED: uncharacterized protein LOC105445018 [Strongylocentrotus purpuratus]
MLNKYLRQDVRELVVVLNHLACELDWSQYKDYYLRNHPTLFSSTPEKSLTPEMKKDLQVPAFWTPLPPSIDRYLYNYIRGAKQDPFPVLSGLCSKTSEMVSRI